MVENVPCTQEVTNLNLKHDSWYPLIENTAVAGSQVHRSSVMTAVQSADSGVRGLFALTDLPPNLSAHILLFSQKSATAPVSPASPFFQGVI